METPEFKAWPSISRWNREIIITEKLDGTNALVWISDDNKEIKAGSRTKWITPENDNFGFAKWVEKNKEDLMSLGPGYHYGEWWGQGIQRGYDLKEKRFSLFNVGRWSDLLGKDKDQRPVCCNYVPILHTTDVPSQDAIRAFLESLKIRGSYASPGFMNPEGIVIFHTASQHLYKYTLGGDGHKTSKKM